MYVCTCLCVCLFTPFRGTTGGWLKAKLGACGQIKRSNRGTPWGRVAPTSLVWGTHPKSAALGEKREKRERRETQGVITLPLQFGLWIWTLLSETRPRCPFAFCVLSVASWEQRAWLKCRCVAEPLRLRRERGSERWREGGREGRRERISC